MTFSFAPATREQARARIGLQGPAGCGKTKTALCIAEGLAQGGTIGLVDTERRSALTYATIPGKPHLGGHDFGHMPMDSYDPRNLIQAVQIAEQAGISVLIVDSWSHFWSGRGGLLEIVEKAGSGALGTFGGWKTGNPIEQDMLDALLNFSGHLIVTMRTKTDYLVDDSGPKKKITKVGTKVVQRDSSDYELGLIIDMVEGTGTVIKTRYEVLEGMSIHHPGADLAATVLEQLGQGVDPLEQILAELVDPELTYPGALDLFARAGQRHLHGVTVKHPVSKKPIQLDTLIKEYGSKLKPAPTTTSTPPTPEPTNSELYAAMESGHPEVEASAAEALAQRGQLPVPPSAVTASMATAQQMRLLHVLLKQLDLTERADVLEYVAGVIGRPVQSRNELTFAEMQQLLDHMQASVPATSAA